MSDTTAGNIQDARGVAVGEGASAQSQTVTINLPPPPQDVSRAPLSEQIRAGMVAIMTLQQMFVADRADRDARQEQIDARFGAIHERLDRLEQLVVRLADIRRWLYALGAPGVAALLVALYELGLRLRWW